MLKLHFPWTLSVAGVLPQQISNSNAVSKTVTLSENSQMASICADGLGTCSPPKHDSNMDVALAEAPQAGDERPSKSSRSERKTPLKRINEVIRLTTAIGWSKREKALREIAAVHR